MFKCSRLKDLKHLLKKNKTVEWRYVYTNLKFLVKLATVKELDKIKGMVWRGRLSGKEEIDVRVRGILKKYRIGKHFDLDIREDGFKYKVNENALIAEETAKSKGNQALIEKHLKRSRRHIESIAKHDNGVVSWNLNAFKFQDMTPFDPACATNYSVHPEMRIFVQDQGMRKK